MNSIFDHGFLAEVHAMNPAENVNTRFPPEPNGHLHIGHSKAIAVNFGFAEFHGGNCFLRYDDTNPAGEEEQFFTSIADTIRWLGFTPARVTHSSDNFEKLFELAEGLIRRDGAYVCHCSRDEIKAQRGGEKGSSPRYACIHRGRPTAESLNEFRAMRNGKYRPGEAALRMKQDIESGNPQMWDLFAYRILDNDATHYRTGNQWRIYPTYDFAHCLCDSIEGITTSLCTTEFEASSESYEWLCKKLDLYTPMQREYGRLNISGTVLSKRKIKALVDEGIVRGWDDPRLYTLIGLRRRGVPPDAILTFVNEIGVTKATTNIQVARLDQTIRTYLGTTVPRLMMVLDPLPVVIDNLPDDFVEMVEVPFSADPSFGTHAVPFTKVMYIERSDFREVDSPKYFRLAPGKTVGLLKVPLPVTATSFERDPKDGRIVRVHAVYGASDGGAKVKKPKAFLHWVAESPAHGSPIRATARLFNSLFRSDDPESNPGGWKADINPGSEEVLENAMIEVGFNEVRSRAPWPARATELNEADDGPESVRFQAMRVGYFAVDMDSSTERVVVNRIVSLKEDSGKRS
ncbi:glutaminyl-tRNA synthetase [Phyllosticta citribraziliensis]|uniref:glutamine--tRNA ligase n=1 Tax=Phyllosticta citribraziliensis TaxID=989973 RepID=A0ABR1LQS5_9PEZI